MSLMRRFQEKKRKDPAHGTTTKVLGTMPSTTLAKQQNLAKIEKEMANDLAALKLIKSIDQKESTKAESLIPKYMPTVKGLMAAGSSHSIIGQVLVWLFDTKDLAEAMVLAVYCIDKAVPMPERFRRDLVTYLCDTIIDWADVEYSASRSTEPYFSQVCTMAEEQKWDLPKQVRAKLYRLKGLIALGNEAFADAVAAFETALEYGAKVKTVLASARKGLESSTDTQNPPEASGE